MAPKKIESLQNPLVKHWAQLRTEKSYREKTQRVLITGKKVIRELSKDFSIETLITIEPSSIAAKERYLVSESILKKITGLNQSDGFAAELTLPSPQNLREKKFLVILDSLADPGNLGTIIRTALALRWEGVILTPDTVDLFNDKALRASKGAAFYLPYARLEREEIFSMLKEQKFHVFTADLEGEKLPLLSFKPPVALILSNEAEGPLSWSEKIACKVTIPMGDHVESLNVSASGAVLLYTMGPR